MNNEGLEALEAIGFYPIEYDGKKYTRIKDEFSKEFEIIERELKRPEESLEIEKNMVLEIIRDKKVDVPYIMENPEAKNVFWYNSSFTGVLCEGWRMLSQEEYDSVRKHLLN